MAQHAAVFAQNAAAKHGAQDAEPQVPHMSGMGNKDAGGDFILGKLRKFDRNNDGTLDKAEVAAVMAELNGGMAPSAQEVQEVLDKLDVDGNGRLNCQELREVLMAWFMRVQMKRAQATDASDCKCAVM